MQKASSLIKRFENEMDKAQTRAMRPLIKQAQAYCAALSPRYQFMIISGMGGYNIQSEQKIPVVYDDESEGFMTLHELQYWFAERGGRYGYDYRPRMAKLDLALFFELCELMEYATGKVHYYFNLST